MSSSKLVVQGAAGALGGESLNVEDVFSTYLYEGNEASSRSISNGINLSDEGGLVWFKARSSSISVDGHELVDTERGVQQVLRTNTTGADSYDADHLTAFNTDGFTISDDSGCNQNSTDYVSWTFRKAPKFFDVVTYTGTGSATTISHNLDSVPGCIIIKRTSNTSDWAVYHRGVDDTAPEDYYLHLNETSARANQSTYFNDTAPTSTEFSVGTNSAVNFSGNTYVAYLFAHNDGDGEFGPDGDADIIKCGSYTGNGSTNGPEIDLGFEPQWVLIKEVGASGNWQLFDSMRGMVVGGSDARIAPNLSNAEDSIQSLTPTATGFKINTTSGNMNTNNSDHIYIAIRRGPMAVPEDADDVFAVDAGDGSSVPAWSSGFPVDMALERSTASDDMRNAARLISGKYLITNSTATETANSLRVFDYMDGWYGATRSTSNYSWMWRRAPNYFDVVCTTGSGAGAITHNLGVVPEMIWHKKRSNDVGLWYVYHSSFSDNEYIRLSSNAGKLTSTSFYTTAPSATSFNVGGGNDMSGAGDTFISYLFASVDGVSKVGTYTGNGTTQNIDCGFSNGARFVIIKRTDANENWHMFDTLRGINSGDDPALRLDTSAAQFNSAAINPYSAGFQVEQSASCNNNVNGGSYMFYAIA